MDYNHIIPEWKNTGTEPSESLKTSGFAGGMRPPAAVFNWFWAKVRNAITELQGNLSTVDDDVTAVENRATSLETRATSLESRATTAESDITSIKSVNTTQNSNISSLTTRAANLETRADSAEDEIAAIKSVNTTQDSSLTSLANRATSLETRATALESGKVDKVSGKGLSTNDFTATYKTKLDGIATGATKVTVDSSLSSSSTNPVQNKVINTALGNKVDKVSGKGLSTNDFTTAYKNKLDNLDEGTVGRALAGQSVMTHDADEVLTVVAGTGAEIFNDYATRTVDENGQAQTGNIASGEYSTAIGTRNTSYGKYSYTSGMVNLALGIASRAFGQYSTAEGAYSVADGNKCHTIGTMSFARGNECTSNGSYAHSDGYKLIAKGFQAIYGKYNAERNGATSADSQEADEAIFSIGVGTSTERANAFTVFADGACKGSTFFGSSGADYPENYEWLDGNPNNEDRRGLFVTLDGEKIRLANAEDDYILGVTSAQGGFVGNSPMEWHDKYVKDVFGARIQEEVTIPESVDDVTGETIPEHTAVQYVVNPEYDPDKEYITREARPEWAWVGLVGQIVVIDDGSCQVNGYCLPSKDGIATAADKSSYRVMSRIDENHVKITIK